jgi:hypothetical protein
MEHAMDTGLLNAKFGRIGARARVGELVQSRGSRAPLTLDVRPDAVGEYFDVRVRPNLKIELDVVDLRRREQHLLLKAREPGGEHYYLCGHDEQHWFVAAIPESAGPLATVFAAMEALKPPEVIQAQRRQGLKGKERFRRKNAAYVRQGEWFFVPAPKVHVDKKSVVLNEPLSRGNGSKPHVCEFLFRKGGELTHVCDEYPQGLTEPEYRVVLRQKPRAKHWAWSRRWRNPEAYVIGKVSHPDHKTINLTVWHRVFMNTEGQSRAMSHVVFLD